MNEKRGWRRTISYLASALAALLAITAVIWALFLDHEVHDLRWKLRSGEVLRYRTTMRMGSTGKEVFHLSESRYTVGVVSSDGTADIIFLQERTIIRQGGPEGPIAWDSTSSAPIPKDYSIAMTAAMTGVPLRYRIDLRGRILSEEGLDVVKKRLRDALGGDMFGAFTEFPFSVTGGTFLGPRLPTFRVKEGARWDSEVRMGTEAWGKSRSIHEYSLKRVQNGVATISLTGSKTIEDSPGDIPKSLNIKDEPDPNSDSGAEDVTEFSIPEGVLLSQVDRRWTQGTLTNGKLFRFESRSETTLIKRSGP